MVLQIQKFKSEVNLNLTWLDRSSFGQKNMIINLGKKITYNNNFFK